MKTASLILFAVTALAQLAVPLWQIRTHEQVLEHGSIVRLKCSAPDPYDPLRGRFLAVRPEETSVQLPTIEAVTPGEPLLITFTTDANGISHVASGVTTPPTNTPYLKVKAIYSLMNKCEFEWPFDRFYINEELAPEADKWFAETIRKKDGVIAEVRVLGGRAVLSDLTFEGQSFREILKERVSARK